YHLGDSMVLYSGLLVLASYWLVRRRGGMIAILLSIPIFFSLLFSYRRGAWLACAAGALVLAWMSRAHKTNRIRQMRWLAPIAIVAVLAVVVYVGSNWQELLTERIVSIGDVYE